MLKSWAATRFEATQLLAVGMVDIASALLSDYRFHGIAEASHCHSTSAVQGLSLVHSTETRKHQWLSHGSTVKLHSSTEQ